MRTRRVRIGPCGLCASLVASGTGSIRWRKCAPGSTVRSWVVGITFAVIGQCGAGRSARLAYNGARMRPKIPPPGGPHQHPGPTYIKSGAIARPQSPHGGGDKLTVTSCMARIRTAGVGTVASTSLTNVPIALQFSFRKHDDALQRVLASAAKTCFHTVLRRTPCRTAACISLL